MQKRIPKITESEEELHQRLKAERDVRKRQRVEMLYILRTGQVKTRQKVAELLGVHRHSVGSWLSAYERGGLQEVCTIHKAPGKTPRVSSSALEALKVRLEAPEGFSSYGQIQQYLSKEHGVDLSYSRVHTLVRYELKAKPKSPRPSAKKKDPAQVKAFVETLPEQVEHIRAEIATGPFERVRLFSGDESRCGLLPVHRHRITLPGVQPKFSVTFQFEFVYLYGAVDPLSGDSLLLELPALNAANFQVFLNEFAAIDPKNLLVLTIDNGRFHKADSLIIPQNVRLLFLPPYAPEINPIERLWRAIKDALAEDPPETLDQLEDKLTNIILNLSPEDIQSLTSYDYFLKAANG